MPPIEVVSTTQPAEQAEKPTGEPGASALAANAAEQTPAAKPDNAETEVQNDSDSEDAEDEGEESESKDAEKDKPKRKSGAVRRRERAERAEAEAARARAEADHWRTMALKGAGEPKAETKVDAKSESNGEPQPDQFETHAEYVKAVVKWDREQADKARDEKAQKSRLETEQKSLLEAHFERTKSFADKTADYDDVIANLDDVQTSETVKEIIVSSENGPELLYELAKDPAEAKRICALSPLAAARELGKLEAKLAAAKPAPSEPKEQKTITKAPKPIAPVGGKGGVVEKSINDPNLSQREYEAIRRKQLAARKSAW